MKLLSAAMIGIALGAVVERSNFCMHSAFQEAVSGRPAANVRAWLATVAIQMVVVGALARAGSFTIVLPPVTPIAAALGGLAFGLGMVGAKG